VTDESHLSRIFDAIGRIEENQKVTQDRMAAIESEMSRYKGFLGGVAFILTGIVTAWELGKEWIIQHIK
jgi:hypothetical protein